MPTPSWFHFFRRKLPSANSVVLATSRPLLIDTGFGSDVDETLELLSQGGVEPARLQTVINTHSHCDHVGGNAVLQGRFGCRIAAHFIDADLVNRGDERACDGLYLVQPVEPYRVDVSLRDGDEIDAGDVTLQVIETPGHSAGQISLYAPAEKLLICGDAVHADDVAWIDIARSGTAAVEQSMASIEKLAALDVRWACSGHGRAMEDPPAAFAAALSRYEKWLTQPERIAWHACKRIFTYELMITGPQTSAACEAYLLGAPWFQAFARNVFESSPQDFIGPMIDEMLRSKAARWVDDRLTPTTPFQQPPADWKPEYGQPTDWPGRDR